MKRAITILMLGTALAFAGCNNSSTSEKSTSASQAQAMKEITGSVSYRERKALPPGSSTIITLSDVSRADAPATELAREQVPMDGRSVPVDYKLTVDPSKIKDGMSYAVRAEIRGPNGQLMWTTDTAHLINTELATQAMEPIWLVAVSKSAPGAGTGLTGKSWTVTSISGTTLDPEHAPTMTFDEAGNVTGYSGCNNFKGTYSFHNGVLTLGPLAMTRKACIGGAGDNETSFVTIIEKIDRVSFDAAGNLVLKEPSGNEIRLK